jgi:hypothetical protein
MTSVAFYRREAQRCRASAVAAQEPGAAVRWLRIAKDYDTLADAIAADEVMLSPPLPPRPQADGAG